MQTYRLDLQCIIQILCVACLTFHKQFITLSKQLSYEGRTHNRDARRIA